MSLILKSSFPENHIDCIWCLRFHPSKNIFASSGSDARIIIWEYNKEISDYTKISTLEKIHRSTIRSLDLDNTGQYLSAASFDNNISIYKMTTLNNANTFSFVENLETNDSEIKNVSWSINGNLIACCSRKGNIWIWEKDLDDFGKEDFTCKSTFEAHKGDIKFVKFCPKDDTLFSCGFDEKIKIWDFDYTKDDFVLINTINEHNGTIWHIEFNKNGNIFFTCSDDKSLIMWGIGNKNEENNCEGNNEYINDYNNILKLVKIENLHLRPIYSCALNFNEKYIFTCSNDGNIGIIKIIINDENDKNHEDNKKTYEMKLIKMIKNVHDQYSVNCICINKNSNKNELISGGDDCNIKIWKFEENE